MNSYAVDIYFDHSMVTVHTIAVNEEMAIESAKATFYGDLGFSESSSFLESAREVSVELLDENVADMEGE